jgi:hypothetical protein
MFESRAEDTLYGWGCLEQHVPQAVRGSRAVVGEVVIVAAEDTQLVEDPIAGAQPVQVGLVDSRGVGDHEAVAAVGLRLTRVEL